MRALLAPADPDQIEHLGGGLYRAKWLDDGEGRRQLEALRSQAERVTPAGGPYEPESGRGWVAVNFSVITRHDGG